MKKYWILIVVALLCIIVFVPFIKAGTVCPFVPPCYESKISVFDWIRYRDNLNAPDRNGDINISNLRETIYDQFKNLTAWKQQDLSDWQFSDYTYENEHRSQLSKYGTGKILLLSKSFNENECQSDCSVERNAQDNLVANVKSSLAQNGWNPVSWPTEPGFYTDYLYVKDNHPLILQIGTRDAVTGGMYLSIQFLY